jgi:hypothetical protein
MRISTRFAGALLVLLGAAAALRVGVLRHARGEDPCAAPGAIRATSLIPGTTALGERLEALDTQTFQWSEGEVANPVFAKLPMQFQIVRSYDAPWLYGSPLALATWPRREPSAPGPAEEHLREAALQPEELRVREADAGGRSQLPIRVAWDHTEAPLGPSRLVAWFFLFDNKPVRSPLAAQLAASFGLALRGPRPLTLVTISALATEQTTGPVEDAAVAWLEDAWSYIARSCEPR